MGKEAWGETLFLEFVRCQRADGTFYGTSGQCRKGREVNPRKEVDKLARKLSATKGDVLRSAVDPGKGLVGKGKDLGNGISVVKGDSAVLEKLGKVPGLPRPVSKVIGERNAVLVARKTVRPWEDLKVPNRAMIPFRKDYPMAAWLNKSITKADDIDMSVNPTLLSARSLLGPSYDRYNREFFGGKLPPVGLFVAPSLTSAVGLAVGKTGDAKSPMFIALSLKHLKNATEEAIHGILLHEMVHINDYANNRWNEGHGSIFTTKLNEINSKWRRDSKKTYVDEIIRQSGSVPKKDSDNARFVSQFPEIVNDGGFRRRAVFDDKYRFLQWK